jgi:hypothetical protein
MAGGQINGLFVIVLASEDLYARNTPFIKASSAALLAQQIEATHS